MNYFMKYINLASVRRAIHVGNLTFNDGSAVEQHLIPDVMQSVKPWIETVGYCASSSSLSYFYIFICFNIKS